MFYLFVMIISFLAGFYVSKKYFNKNKNIEVKFEDVVNQIGNFFTYPEERYKEECNMEWDGKIKFIFNNVELFESISLLEGYKEQIESTLSNGEEYSEVIVPIRNKDEQIVVFKNNIEISEKEKEICEKRKKDIYEKEIERLSKDLNN